MRSPPVRQIDAAAGDGGALWRTMGRDRRRVACRICAYAQTAPLKGLQKRENA
ncbi:hypothetical protein M8994_06835 [Brucella sp. 21LCYQ03]|nr:hypothetical protein [Brucella sp. 21LCYQ03]